MNINVFVERLNIFHHSGHSVRFDDRTEITDEEDF
jgi:hypothetical protein